MKVIEPLFLNELYEEFENANRNQKKLNALLNRIHNLKIFDPACGSGNFLIIAYKELRILEMKIFKAGNMMALSGIQLSQFYGIEIDDFAGEIAKLALWLAEHQMNVEFFKEFGRTNPTLPLKEAGIIVQGNATRLDWEDVCAKTNNANAEPTEVYILGNPPYLGARNQEKNHKDDMDFVLSSFTKYRDLDYIACWFYKGAKYINDINAKLAFVSTNSICQGLQVGLLWPNILKLGVEIYFAHTSFEWTNNARNNAGITVAIIGLANISKKPKTIYYNGIEKKVRNINAYLSSGTNTIVQQRSKPLSDFIEMSFGNMPNDGGGLILSKKDKRLLLEQFPIAKKYIKKLLGAKEFTQGQTRYCLWISNEEKKEAEKISFIANCIEKTRNHRLSSKDSGTNKLAERSHQFRDTNSPEKTQIIIPSVSTERREYIQLGFIGTDTVITNLALVIYDAESYFLGLLSSKMHIVWLKNIGGKLRSHWRYSKDIVYNTFPFPPISTQRKNEITQATFRILEEREKHSNKTLAQLYDPDKMPDGLREAHRQNDEIIEKCYRSTPFKSDEERLEYLFKLYEKMIAEEKEQGTLFAKEKKTRKKR
jgi:hypothetical protein